MVPPQSDRIGPIAYPYDFIWSAAHPLARLCAAIRLR